MKSGERNKYQEAIDHDERGKMQNGSKFNKAAAARSWAALNMYLSHEGGYRNRRQRDRKGTLTVHTPYLSKYANRVAGNSKMAASPGSETRQALQ
jgi:hypothetical protein